MVRIQEIVAQVRVGEQDGGADRCQMIGALESGVSQNLVFGPHGAQQTHCVDRRQEKDESHSAKPDHQGETQATGGIISRIRSGL